MKIQIILGSKSDMHVAEKAEKILKQFSVTYNIAVASAHRTPEIVKKTVEENDANVFIGVAGLAAAEFQRFFPMVNQNKKVLETFLFMNLNKTENPGKSLV